MEIVIGVCRSGREVELLKTAARENKRILCYSKAQAEHYAKKAAELGLKIPQPIAYEDKELSCR